MPRTHATSFWHQLRDALFLDLPWVLDSALRHSDFNANTRYVLRTTSKGSLRWRWRAPVAMALPLVAVLIFALYGPTFDSLCSVFPPPHTAGFLRTAAGLLVLLMGFLAWRLWNGVQNRQQARIEWLHRQGQPTSLLRRALLLTVLISLSLVPIAPLVTLVYVMLNTAADASTCSPVTGIAPSAVYQLLAAVLLSAATLMAPSRLPRWMLWTPVCVILSILSVILLWQGLTDANTTEAAHLPYRTLYAPLAALFFLAAFPAKLAVQWIVGDLAAMPVGDAAQRTTFTEALARALTRCELFVKREDPTFGWTRIGYALLSAPLLHPLLLLLIPSFAAVIASHDDLFTWFWTALAVAWLLLALGSVSGRWNQQIVLVRHWLLRSLSLGVSLLVIALALCRLANVEYVSYVMDAASFGALTLILLMCYVLAWAMEGCLHRPLQVELLALLAPASAKRVRNLDRGRVGYQLDPQQIATDVPPRRWLQPHGDGRFAVVARRMGHHDPVYFHTYSEYDLFERLVNNEQRFLTADEHSDLMDRLHELRRRLRIYFTLATAMSLLVLVSFILCAAQADQSLQRDPMARVTSAADPVHPGYDLLTKLQAHAAQHKDQPVLLVAASGGGTRAALFTTAALRGLTDAGYAPQIQLMSGVSGGGVSLAYFAAHRSELLKSHTTDPAWTTYLNAMEYNHIGEVLEGSGEWRLLRHQSLAQLLTESFQLRFGLTTDTDQFTQLKDIGLILNTTIAGHPYRDSSWLTTLFDKQDAQPLRTFRNGRSIKEMAFSRFAGGRLIFTNLSAASHFPERRPDPAANGFAADFDLTYKVIRDPAMPITAAAALNANFPPVFANSGVWVYPDAAHQQAPDKYYVTDGGINENRGLISILYAVDSALAQQLALDPANRKPLPDMDIVVLEASASGFNYSQDRGLNATLSSGAKERLASGLERALLTNINLRIQQIDTTCSAGAPANSPECSPKIRVHYLLMPATFVTRGGLGTHWMLPNTVSLSDPRDPQATPDATSIEMDKHQASTLIQCLFAGGSSTVSQQACKEVTQKLPTDWLGNADTEACTPGSDAAWCVNGWRSLLAQLAKNKQP